MRDFVSFNRLVRQETSRTPPVIHLRHATVNQARRLNVLVLPIKKAKYMPLDFDLKGGTGNCGHYFFQPGKSRGGKGVEQRDIE